MAKVMDIAKIERELQDLHKQREQAKESLDAMRAGGRGRGRGLPGAGRGEGPARAGGVLSRLGSSGDRMNGGPRAGPRDEGPGPARPSVFDRLYSSRSTGHWGHDVRDSEPHQGRPHRDLDRHASLPAAAAAADAGGGGGGSERRPLSSRLASRIAGSGREQQPHGRDDAARGDADRDEGGGAAGGALSGRKRLLSAVMVNGQARSRSGGLQDGAADRDDAPDPGAAADAEPAPAGAGGGEERPAKRRPAVQADDQSKRRARRMLGALLVGTLQKAQSEDLAFRTSTAAQRRAELQARAVERVQAEDARAREEAATARREEREAKYDALHNLTLQADIKALELRVARRFSHKQALSGFCLTAAQPPLQWLPKRPSGATDALLQKVVAGFESWKQQQLAQLEEDKQALAATAAAKREAALARLAARQGGEAEGDGGGGGGEGEAEEEDGQAGGSGGKAGGDAGDGDEEGEEGEEQQQKQQDSGEGAGGDDDDDDEQQQQQEGEGDEDMDEAEAAAKRAARQRRRQRAGDDEEEEERLLSSDEDE